MKISQIVSTEIEVADPNMTLEEAADLMRSADVGALPVVDRGELLGIITDRNERRCVVGEAHAERRSGAEL